MRKKLMDIVGSLFVAFLMAFSTLFAPLAPVFAANNGTLKVHDVNSPTGTEDTEPKVCAFDFEGFGFDPGQDGYIEIEVQGNDAPHGADAGPFAFGPANASGYAITNSFNNGPGTPTIINGHYKATLYGKDVGSDKDTIKEKAKSKNFKVDCPTSAIPDPVTFADPCGTADDKYTISNTEGVNYQISGNTVAAGIYAGSGTVTVTAVAKTGYVLSGTTVWAHTFTNVACPVPDQHTTATVPSMVDLVCNTNGSYTIPSKTSVTYKVDGTVTPAGTYAVATAGGITITAEAQPGYVLDGTTSWAFTFNQPRNCKTPVTPAAVTFNDSCGISNDTFTVPTSEGVTYKRFVIFTVPAGTYNALGGVTITAVAKTGYVLQGTTSWTYNFSHTPCPIDVTPFPPFVLQDLTCDDEGWYKIPLWIGVVYKVNGNAVWPGFYEVDTPGDINITAEALPGFVLNGQTSWTLSFPAPDDCEPEVDDLCLNIDDIQAQVPTGLIRDNQGNCYEPEDEDGCEEFVPRFVALDNIQLNNDCPEEDPEEDPETPQVLGDSTTADPTPTPQVQGASTTLVNTGSSMALNMFVAMFLLGSTAAITLATRKTKATL